MSRRKRSSHDPGPQVAARVAGPLGPWRLAIAVSASTVLTSIPLSQALSSGVDLDAALAKSAGVAFLAWFAAGRIDRILARATPTEADLVVATTGDDERTPADAQRR